VGTSILTGATAERFEIVKWFYIKADDDTGFDAATDIIARAMANLHHVVPANHGSEIGTVDEARDLLDDLDQVLGTEKIGTADIPALLRDLAPGWTPYQRLTGTALRTILHEQYGITVPRAHNTWPLNPATVRERIVNRAHTGHDGTNRDGAGPNDGQLQ
jgi:DNA segregation ATPase FtsK/SpoIIIE, S-DNA-T family